MAANANKPNNASSPDSSADAIELAPDSLPMERINPSGLLMPVAEKLTLSGLLFPAMTRLVTWCEIAVLGIDGKRRESLWRPQFDLNLAPFAIMCPIGWPVADNILIA